MTSILLLSFLLDWTHAQEMEGLPPPPSEFKFEVLDGYVYEPRSRRDPFKPYGVFFEAKMPSGTASGEKLQLLPLQNFDLDQLAVVAVLWEVDEPRALIRDPAGKTHTVRRGEKIGNLGGVVAVIREGELVVLEQRASGGKIEKTPRVLTVRR